MKIKLLILLLILSMFLVSGCVERVVCNKPYIQVGTECCLDTDGNGICDKDEPEAKVEEKAEEYCGDGICQLNERAYECEDCEADVELRHVVCEIEEATGNLVIDDLLFDYTSVNFGDSILVFPSVDLYAGWSDAQCLDKKNMQLQYEYWGAPIEKFVVKDSEITKEYDSPLGVTDLNSELFGESPQCFYFVFKLYPYNSDNPPRYGVQKPYNEVAKWESNINPCN